MIISIMYSIGGVRDTLCTYGEGIRLVGMLGLSITGVVSALDYIV